MKSIKFILTVSTLLFLLASGPFPALGSGEKNSLEVPIIETSQWVALGQLPVEPLGIISFSGRKSGNQIIVQAMGPEGQVVGRAETVSGVRETPIYVTSPSGLKKIILLWKNPK